MRGLEDMLRVGHLPEMGSGNLPHIANGLLLGGQFTVAYGLERPRHIALHGCLAFAVAQNGKEGLGLRAVLSCLSDEKCLEATATPVYASTSPARSPSYDTVRAAHHQA